MLCRGEAVTMPRLFLIKKTEKIEPDGGALKSQVQDVIQESRTNLERQMHTQELSSNHPHSPVNHTIAREQVTQERPETNHKDPHELQVNQSLHSKTGQERSHQKLWQPQDRNSPVNDCKTIEHTSKDLKLPNLGTYSDEDSIDDVDIDVTGDDEIDVVTPSTPSSRVATPRQWLGRESSVERTPSPAERWPEEVGLVPSPESEPATPRHQPGESFLYL